jgi:hypothetical protein
MKHMKKTFVLVAALGVLSTAGCYTSRRIAGDDLVGGPLNPYLWVTVPVDTVLSPYQIPKWMADENDPWRPFDPDEIRREYHPSHFNQPVVVR